MAEAAPANAELLEWLKKDEPHAVHRVDDLEGAIKSYAERGYKLLRKRDNPEEKYSKAFLGFGPEESLVVVELICNYGVSSSDVRPAFGRFAIATQDGNQMVARKFLNTKIPEKINDVMASVPETNSGESRWRLDTGASHHGCKDKSLMMEFREADPNKREVQMAAHSTAEIKGQGFVELDFPSGEKIKLENVLYVPELRENLVSVGLLDEMGLRVTFGSRMAALWRNDTFVGVADAKDGLYELELN